MPFSWKLCFHQITSLSKRVINYQYYKHPLEFVWKFPDSSSELGTYFKQMFKSLITQFYAQMYVVTKLMMKGFYFNTSRRVLNNLCTQIIMKIWTFWAIERGTRKRTLQIPGIIFIIIPRNWLKLWCQKHVYHLPTLMK